jgi:tripartite-type tricarboxylate transporter receptor subunit TctC
MMRRRNLLQSMAAASLATVLPARAQGAYPERAIRIIVPLPPGSPPDVLARLVADGISRAWKQPVVVDNRPGATGMVGMQAVARAAPDGYTMGVMFLTHTVLPALMGTLTYDTANDLAPVGNLVWLYNVLVVPIDSPVQSLADLVQRAGVQPDVLSFGSGGNGSPAHLIGESFARAAKVRMLHVPFKGPAEAVTGLLGNQVSAMFATSSVAAPLVRGGKLRALAVTSPHRLAALPEVQTLAEAGMPGLELREWEGLVAPAGTTKSIIDRWNAELFRVLGTQEARLRLAELGMTVAASNAPDEFGALIRSELKNWGQFVRSAGIRPG